MKKLRILVMMHASLVPPEDPGGLTEAQVEDSRTELDVISTLRAAGHEVRPVGILDALGELRATLREWQPHVCFNLLEEFAGIVAYDSHVVGLLELMRQPYTGCNPRGMMLSRDKVLSKQILAYHRIPTPQFAVFPRGARFKVPRKLRYPLFVKSATEDASLGISKASLVEDAARLTERVQFIHEQTSSDALVEEYIEGREFYVGVLGNERLTTLPVWEFSFGSMAGDGLAFATRKAKWDRKYKARHGIGANEAGNLPEGAAARLAQAAKRIYRALYMTGYARMDFRMRPDGSIFVLEANANPMLAAQEDFSLSAAAAGIRYEALLERIVTLGLNYRAQWRELDA
jgi:D-alanine-D-alanine ligase